MFGGKRLGAWLASLATITLVSGLTVFGAAPAALATHTLTLTPATDTNPINTSHTVTAKVKNGSQNVGGAVVNFTVSGANSTSGSCTTASNGTCTFSYTGTNAGTDTINATTTPAEGHTATATATKVWEAADLSITKADSSDPLITGASYSYTLVVSNAGPSTAHSVVVSDPLPSGVAFVDYTSTQGTCIEAPAGTLTCNLSDIASGGSVTIVFNVTAPLVAGEISNTATVSSDASVAPDPNSENNSDSETTEIAASADLSITKADSSDPVLTGGSYSYTLLVSNGGASTAENVLVTDPLPGGVAFVDYTSTQGTCVEGPVGTITCALGDIPSGGSVTIVLNVTAPPDAGQISNTATVFSDTDDPDETNNIATETTDITAHADLSITKTDSSDPVLTGGSYSYTLVVSNAGLNDAENVMVSDTLPSGVGFSGYTSTQGTCTEFPVGTLTCDLGTVTSGGSVTIVFNLTAPLVAGQISNTATVSSDTDDTDETNNTATETTDITANADLSITKADSEDPVLTGGSFSYTLVVSNGGVNDAENVVVSDTLPSGVTFVDSTSTQGTCTEAPAGTITCDLGTIPSGGLVTIVFNLTAPLVGGQISNTATVSSDTLDPNDENNSATETTDITAHADLSITKTDSADPVLVGGSYSYTLTVSNGGLNDAESVVVTDTLPSGVTLVDATPDQGTCTEDPPGTVTCDLGTVSSGGSVTIVFNVTAPAVAGQVSNTATVTSETVDPDETNNTATETTNIVGGADIALTKTASPTSPVVGGSVLYTLTVANNGPDDAPDVIVTDTLPADATLSSPVTTSQGTCAVAGSTITCDLGPMTSGSSATITFKVRYSSGGSKENCGTAFATAPEEPKFTVDSFSSSVLDPDETNNTGCVTVNVVSGAISFESNQGGLANIEVFRIDESGSGTTALTANSILQGPDITPSWNAEKTSIAFSSNQKSLGDVDLYTMKPDGTSIARRTNNVPVVDTDPDFDKSGNILVFVTDRYTAGNLDIASLNLSNGVVTRLTTSLLDDVSPSVCPNGTIVWVSGVQIWRMSANGSGKVQLTTSAGLTNLDPACSPDSNRVAFSRNLLTSPANYEVYTMSIAGEGAGVVVRVTNRSGIDIQPSWRPDGGRLVFSSNADGNFDLWLVNPTGSGLKQLTFTTGLPTVNLHPDWS